MENTEGINILMAIVLGTLGMLTLASFIIVFVVFYQKRALEHQNKLQESQNLYQKQLLAATIEVAEEERKRVASNIHDDLGIILNTVKLNEKKIELITRNHNISIEHIETNSILLDDAIHMIRTISYDLMPPALIKLGFVKAIRLLARQLSETGTTKVSLITNENELRLNEKTELHLYRLCNEILNNILKHAAATSIEIRIVKMNTILHTDILHNGIGISNSRIMELMNTNRGIGLKSIFSRAQLTNSTINYYTTDKESKVSIETPVS